MPRTKPKKKKPTHEEEQEPPQRTMANEEASDADSDDDDDDDLRAMAAAWAQDNDQEVTQTSSTTTRGDIVTQPAATAAAAAFPAPPNTHSIYIAQLPFDVTEWEIRQFFDQHSNNTCTLTDVRLVRDQGVCRGVAFAECATDQDYQTALSLHHHKQFRLRGRRLQIRPTKTKAELADIVSQREALVQAKVAELLQRKRDSTKEGQQETPAKARKRERQRSKKRNKDSPAKRTKTNHKEGETSLVKDPSTFHAQAHRSVDKQSDSSKVSNPTARPRHKKLSKKERNRRAAILMGKRCNKVG